MIMLWVDSKLVKKVWQQELFLEGMINKKMMYKPPCDLYIIF